MVEGTPAGMPEYSITPGRTGPYDFRGNGISNLGHDGMPLSSDTSRSPIPIDPETYRNLHRNLIQEGTSNNDLPAYHSRSRSRGDPSPLERSMESNDAYKTQD
jgi:hypothetical protein